MSDRASQAAFRNLLDPESMGDGTNGERLRKIGQGRETEKVLTSVDSPLISRPCEICSNPRSSVVWLQSENVSRDLMSEAVAY